MGRVRITFITASFAFNAAFSNQTAMINAYTELFWLDYFENLKSILTRTIIVTRKLLVDLSWNLNRSHLESGAILCQPRELSTDVYF